MLSNLLTIMSSLIGLALALAAIPPRSLKNLQDNSTYIIVGNIKHKSQKEVTTSIGTDIHYTVLIAVETIEKDESMKLGDYFNPPVIKQGHEIAVHYWQTGERPAGWTGPTGLYDQPQANENGRFFLTLNESDQLTILAPNGWQLIS